MKKLFGVLAAFSLLAVAFFARPALAQNPNQEERITLSPAVFRPKLEAGQTAEGKLTVINDGSAKYTFVLYARPFSVVGEQYDPNYTEVNERTEAYQWVQFDKTKLDLAPGERVEVGYTLTVPEKAKGGGHYAVLFAETQPPEDSSSVSRKKRVGSLLYMTVDGDVIQEGSLAGWSVPFLQTSEPISSDLRIKNSGNTHFQADLSAQYSNIFGKKQFELNQELLILPGTTRRVSVNWSNPPLFGIFKASGTVNYLDKTETLPSKWVLFVPRPLLIFLAVVVILAILIFWLKRYRQNGSRKFRGDLPRK